MSNRNPRARQGRVHPAALASALASIGGAIGALRSDGWANPYTGIGTSRDKQTYSQYCPAAILSSQELSNLFHSDDIVQRIVSTRPSEMLRAGYVVTTDDEELAKGLREDAEKLGVDRAVYEAMVWGKTYGGGAIILGARDGRLQELPLDEKRVRSIEFLSVLDARYIFPENYFKTGTVPGITQPVPTIYRVTSPLEGGLSLVHESRVIRFEGAMTDANVRRQLHGWSLSELQRAYDVLQLFGMSFASVGHLLQDASQGVFKMKDLHHNLASNRDALMKRMELVEVSRSVARAVLLDADMEDFTRVTTSFAGLPELLDRIMQRLSAATQIPVTLLMGRSAAGMNATGDSDFRAFYDSVASDQTKLLGPPLTKIYRLLAIARGADPSSVSITFNKLWEPTEAEESLTEKQDADRDVALIGAGVLLPEEVAIRIARRRRKVSETEIDIAAREKSLKIELDMLTDPQQHIGPADEAKAQEDLAKAKGAAGKAAPPKKP